MSSREPRHDAAKDAAAKPLDKCLERLEKIADELDKPDLPLEESMKLFEEGITLARDLEKRLNEAEGRIEQLLRLADGEGHVAPLEIPEDGK